MMNAVVSIILTFGWITPIHAPKIGVLGLFDPNGLQYANINKNQKGDTLARVHVI